MNIEQCIQCEWFVSIIQTNHYTPDGSRIIGEPERVHFPYCCHYILHLDWVEQILEGDEECPFFYAGEK